MSDFQDLIIAMKSEALESKLISTAEGDWRWFCRQYSEKFHTALHLVMEMDPEWVIQQVFESQLDKMEAEDNIEEIMDKIYSIEDPSYEAAKEKDLQDFIKDAEEEEERRVAMGLPSPGSKSKPKEFRKPHKPVQEKPKKELPKEGYINLSYLEKDENER